MKLFARALLAASVVALGAATAPAANAQNVFDMLFGGGMKRQQQQQVGAFPPPPPEQKPAQKKAAPVAKISAPSYYDYKVEPLVRAEFPAVLALARTAAAEPMLSGSAFREAISGLEGFELRTEKDIAKALDAYYSANPDFIWVSGFDPNERAREAIRTLGDADSFGLDAAEYAVTVPQAGSSGEDSADRLGELMRFEMKLSARVLRYVRDAQGGRIDPNKLSGYHDFPAKPVDLAGTLRTLAHTQEVRTFLESRHPQNPQFQALRVELEALKASAENEIVVDAKLLLKPGQSSPELPKVLSIIARDLDDEMGGEFGETLARLRNSETYVKELVPVVKAAQERVGLKPDGVIGPRTVATLVGTSKADRLDKVLIALEQLRWLPSDLGSPRVFVNQPAFMASYIEGEEEKLSMRVVIGRPSNQTSFFYDEIEQVDYNPYWGVPQSIIVNEMLPRLRSDPGYLDRAGYEVTDAKGKRIPSSAIDWSAYGSAVPFNVRQSPSEANALGELKILFPNKHAIYMHDTPQKALFDRETRAFSHGCIRLHNPRAMAAAVLGTSVDYVAQKLKQGHSSEKVKKKIPIYISYFTAWPNQDGKVEYFGDVYDRDARVLKAFEKTDAARLAAS